MEQIEDSRHINPLLTSDALVTASALGDGRLPPAPYRLSADTALPYRTGRREGVCRLRLFQPAASLVTAESTAILLATELLENRKLSVTNGIEVIAVGACARYGLSPRHTVLIEHYDDRENGYAARLPERVNGETFSCVTFAVLRSTEEGLCLRRPRWRRLSKGEIEAFLGAPLP